MEKIIEIILNCNSKRKLLSFDDVREICQIILDKSNCSFVNKIDLFQDNPVEKNCAAVYYDDHIFFFFEPILEKLDNCCTELLECKKMHGSRVDVYNYFYLGIIFHELAHVRQYYITQKKHNSLEKKIFKIYLNLSENRDFYHDNYFNILTEVNANNVASVMANYIYSKLPRNFLTQNDRNIYQSNMLRNLLYDNYEIDINKEVVISPSERITENLSNEILSNSKIDLNKYLMLIYSQNNLTIYKKLMLGLPISYLEYAYVNLLSDELYGSDKINVTKKLQKIIK